MVCELIDRLLRAERISLAEGAIGKRDFRFDVDLLIDGIGAQLQIGRPFEGNEERMWGILNPVELTPRRHHFTQNILSVEVCLRSVSQFDLTLPSLSRLIFNCEFSRLVVHPSVDSFAVPCAAVTLFDDQPAIR